MYMRLRRGLRVKRFRDIRVLSTLSTLILIAIGLIALAETQPPKLYVFRGASPFNDGVIGTMDFMNMVRSRYPDTISISSLHELNSISKADRCLYIVVSPEIPYSVEEARYIANTLISRCNTLSFLIADENTTSNNILTSLDSDISIDGRIIYSNVYGFYPPTYIDLRDIAREGDAKVYSIVLDIASPINVKESAIVIGRTVDGYTVAVYRSLHMLNRSIEIIAIGDGSIFLNQVMRSNTTIYRDLAMSLTNILCGYDNKCKVIFDGSHYQAIDPLNIFSSSSSFRPSDIASLAIYQDVFTIALSVMLRFIHPSTWLPPLVEYINRFFVSITTSFLLSTAIAVILMAIVYRVFLRRENIVVDQRLPEVREVEMFVFRDLRESIARGKYRLTKHDFVNLFEIIDNVFRSVVGVELCSNRALEYISSLVGSEKAGRYVDRMCRGYRKAVRGGIRPFILSWHRYTMSMIRESESILNAMGYTLTREKGVEYIFLK